MVTEESKTSTADGQSALNSFVSLLSEHLETGQKRYERIAYLVKCNGGFQVCGWGFIGGGYPWQRGLDQNDAIELMQWSSFFDGVAFCGVDVGSVFKPMFDEYVARIEAQAEAS